VSDTAPIHYKTKPGARAPLIACGAHPLRIANHTEDVGKVTCFGCRKTEVFKADQLEGVGTPTPLPQREMPRLLKDIVAEDPVLVDLNNRAWKAALPAAKNSRDMYVIEELIHHGEYRTVRRVEMYDINPVTVDAVLISSAYCYGSWLDPNAQHAAARRPKLFALVDDLRHGRVNRTVGWSTFRLITDHS
jgi:hypothetical protein